MFVPTQGRTRKRLRQRRAHAGFVDALSVAPDRDDGRRTETLSVFEDREPSELEHRRLDLGRALQANLAVVILAKSVLHVRSERAGLDLIERWLRRVSEHHLRARLEGVTAAPRPLGEDVLVGDLLTHGVAFGAHDRLVQKE